MALTVTLALPGQACASEAVSPLPAPQAEADPATPEQLRVYRVGQQLLQYLAEVLVWTRPDSGVRRTAEDTSALIKAALEQHPEVQLAFAQADSAAIAVSEAEGAFYPKVSTTLETGGKRNDPVSAPWARVPSYRDNSQAVSLTGRQLVYDFGASSRAVDARLAELDGTKQRAQSKASDTALRALSAWIEVQRARSMKSLAQMNVAARQEILAFVQERETLGASSQADVLRVRARVADALANLVVETNRAANAESAYQELFNTPAPANLGMPPLPKVSADLYPDFAAIREQNPLLLEARAASRSADAAAQALAASLKPGLYLEVSARRRDLGSAAIPGTDWSAGLVVNQSLYSGGVDTARLRQAQQKAKESKLAEDGMIRQLDRALSQTMANVLNASIAVSAKQQSVTVASSAIEAIREQYAYRRGSLLDLLKAQEELYLAGKDLIDSFSDQTLIAYRWLHLASRLESTVILP